jgi:hypothetical protein
VEVMAVDWSSSSEEFLVPQRIKMSLKSRLLDFDSSASDGILLRGDAMESALLL